MFGVTPPVEFRGVDAVTAVTTPTRLPPLIVPVTSKLPFMIVLAFKPGVPIMVGPLRNAGPSTSNSYTSKKISPLLVLSVSLDIKLWIILY
jgi:hypothetical protein